MKLLTRWQEWWVRGRDEHKFHCDLILAPGETVAISAEPKQFGEALWHIIQAAPDKYIKVHLAASWEERDTEFVE